LTIEDPKAKKEDVKLDFMKPIATRLSEKLPNPENLL